MTPPFLRFTLLSLAALSVPHGLSAATVSNTDDSGPGSLRDAIANATTGETIDFDPALNGQAIILTSGELTISDLDISIDASGLASGVIVNGNAAQRIFNISGESDVSLKRLHLRDGSTIASLGQGAGIFATGGRLLVEDCSVRDCQSFSSGGGIYIGSGVTEATIRRCFITGNSTSTAGSGGGIYVTGFPSVAISSTVVSGNTSAAGGGITIVDASPVLTNCTIQGNSQGGVRSTSGAAPLLRNCIVWGNEAGSGTTAAKQLSNSNPAQPQVTYSLIQGANSAASFNDGGLVVWGAGNLNGTSPAVQPAFVNPTGGADLRLLAGSAAIDQGDAGVVEDPLDLAGRPRILGPTVDLGAFEGFYVSFALLHPTLTPKGDANNNGVSNLAEYAMALDPTIDHPEGLPNFPESEPATLSFHRRTNALDLAATWLTSVNNSDWFPMKQGSHYSAVAATTLDAISERLDFTLITTAPWRFYRQSYSIGE